MRTWRWVALALVSLSIGLTAFSLASLLLPGAADIPDRPDALTAVIFSLIFASFPAVGGIVAWQRPSHPVGWLLLATGLGLVVSVFGTEYGGRVVYSGADLPAYDVVAWAGGWGWYVAAGVALPLMIGLFPTGVFLGPRWRVAHQVLSGLLAAAAIGVALLPGDLEGWEGAIRNPFGVSGPLVDLTRLAQGAGTPLLVVHTLVAVTSIGRRFRRSTGPERAQLKWLLLPVAILLAGLVLASLPLPEPLLTASWTAALVGFVGVPLGAGVAILRHRLLDIDVVIRRTLLYAALVAVLGSLYVGMILGLQAVLIPLTGGQSLPVAISTLAIAALFVPVRARVRSLIDRRFDRSRYDAARMLESFSARLRDEVELDAVGRSLVGAASDAVHPATVAVWLRGPAGADRT